MKQIIDKLTGHLLYTGTEYNSETQEAIESDFVDGFYKPRWNGEEWEEGATQEYINSLKSQAEPHEPTAEERLAGLEQAMLDMMGGMFQ